VRDRVRERAYIREGVSETVCAFGEGEKEEGERKEGEEGEGEGGEGEGVENLRVRNEESVRPREREIMRNASAVQQGGRHASSCGVDSAFFGVVFWNCFCS
jgi:hypothetical protein